MAATNERYNGTLKERKRKYACENREIRRRKKTECAHECDGKLVNSNAEKKAVRLNMLLIINTIQLVSPNGRHTHIQHLHNAYV